MELPSREFGQGRTRSVRLIASPQTTGEERISLVYVVIPPETGPEVHSHPDCDEYIFFESAGRAILDGEEIEVPAKAVLHAKAGVNHAGFNPGTNDELKLFCVFTPAFTPYGQFPPLIDETKTFFNGK